MNSNHNTTAEELWQKIITLKTTQEWMELTNVFSLYTIYHHCRILQDPEKIETYQCMIRKEYPKSLVIVRCHASSNDIPAALPSSTD